MSTTRSAQVQFTPGRNSACLCGSGRKYKRCCSELLLEKRAPGVRPRQFIQEERYEEALTECRADIVQYTIWHKRHTEPAIRAGAPPTLELLKIDLLALSELVELLYTCFRKLGIGDEFAPNLERLRLNIHDSRWQRRITYLQALCAMGEEWNEEAGRRELKRLEPLDEETDPEIMQLYLDLFSSELAFSEKVSLAERIIHHSRKSVDVLHYRCLRGLLYLLIGDKREAERSIEEAVSEFRSEDLIALTNYQKYRFAHALFLLADVKQEVSLAGEAVELLREMKEDDNWTQEGKAEILRSIGEGLQHLGRWADAITTFDEALALGGSEVCSVFASQCLLSDGRLEEGKVRLLGTRIERLTPAEHNDFTFTLAEVAAELKERELISRGEHELREMTLHEPSFRERRDQLLLELADAKRQPVSDSFAANVKRRISKMVRLSTRYLILQPNIGGIGVDLGQIGEDLAKAGDEHVDRECTKL